MESTEPRKLGKRDAILRAAIDVFSRKGYHNARMEEIALAAGAGKGTVYEYFESKLQLFQEMMELGWKFYNQSIAAEELENLSFREQLELTITMHLKWCLEHRQLTRVVFIEADIIDEDMKNWLITTRRQKEDLVERWLDKAIAAGTIRPLNTRITSSMICAIIPYLSMQLILQESEADPEKVAREITRNLMEGIANK